MDYGPYQPAQAWLSHAGGRLALLHPPSLCGDPHLSAGLVRIGSGKAGGVGVTFASRMLKFTIVRLRISNRAYGP